MKTIYLLILMFVVYSNYLYSQDSTIQTSVNQRYYYENDSCYNVIELAIINIGDSEYVMWVSKSSIVGLSDEILIHDYFIKQKGDFSLLNLIYENLYEKIPIQIGDSFLKKLKHNEKFTFVFLLRQKMDESYALNFYRDKIVLIDKEKIENRFHIQNKQDIYYPFDNIILYR